MEYTSLTNQPPDLNFPKSFISSFSSCFDEKVNNKFISLDATKKSKSVKRRSIKLNSKKLKNLGLSSIPKEMQTFNIYVEMHQLWKEYMNDFLKDERNPLNKVLKAELVGSFLTIVESKNPTLVGISGILIRESCNMFYIISRADRLYKISKLNTNFTFCWNDSLFTVYGTNTRYKPSDRSNKKIKIKASIEL